MHYIDTIKAWSNLLKNSRRFPVFIYRTAGVLKNFNIF